MPLLRVAAPVNFVSDTVISLANKAASAPPSLGRISKRPMGTTLSFTGVGSICVLTILFGRGAHQRPFLIRTGTGARCSGRSVRERRQRVGGCAVLGDGLGSDVHLAGRQASQRDGLGDLPAGRGLTGHPAA